MSDYHIADTNTLVFDNNLPFVKAELFPIFLEIFMRLGWEIIAIDPSNIIAKTASKWGNKGEIFTVTKSNINANLVVYDSNGKKLPIDEKNNNVEKLLKDYVFIQEHISQKQYDDFSSEFKLFLNMSKENDQSLAKFKAGTSPEQISDSFITKLIKQIS